MPNLLRRFLDNAVDTLDDKFGPDYAKKNPALVAKLAEIGFELHLDESQEDSVCVRCAQRNFAPSDYR